MKNFILLLLIFAQYSCNENERSSNSSNTLGSNSNIIKYIDFNTTTLSSVTCEMFDRMSNIDSVFVTDKEIDSINLYAEKFHLDTTRDIDTRGKIIFSVNAARIEYCFDKFGIFYREKRCFTNPDMFKFITNRILK